VIDIFSSVAKIGDKKMNEFELPCLFT